MIVTIRDNGWVMTFDLDRITSMQTQTEDYYVCNARRVRKCITATKVKKIFRQIAQYGDDDTIRKVHEYLKGNNRILFESECERVGVKYE